MSCPKIWSAHCRRRLKHYRTPTKRRAPRSSTNCGMDPTLSKSRTSARRRLLVSATGHPHALPRPHSLSFGSRFCKMIFTSSWEKASRQQGRLHAKYR